MPNSRRGEIRYTGGTPLKLTGNAVGDEFYDFYPFNDIETISPRPLLFIAGAQAHSREFIEDTYTRAAGA